MANHKYFLAIDEQIELLKSRGLVINDEERAFKYLLTNNYYDIINGYSKYFQKDPSSHDDLYLSNATFDEVCNLYFFDKKIKQTLFNSIINVEHHLRSIFSYRFSEAHQKIRYPYLNINFYDHAQTLEMGYTLSRLTRVISNNARYKNNAIYHYVHAYDDVPTWVLVEFLDFGTLYNLIKGLNKNMQNKIALDLSDFILTNNHDFNDQFTPKCMLSFIKNIHEIRNVCAHNNRLIGFTCRSDSVYFPFLHNQYGITKDMQRRKTFSTFISMQCFLSRVEYATLNNTIRKRFRTLSNKLDSIDINCILDSLGFPPNWQEQDTLPQ